ncbi:MAG: CPP1-like family protein [Cyanobacteriota bacterium]|nr:CPP1-like family protein [Cyanobacteriota bacterium]
MNSSPDQPQPAAGAPDPYGLLGVTAEASFEEVQTAKQNKLLEVGEDPLARARIEAAYDAVLMGRLKERQQGKVSTAARSASVREDAVSAAKPAVTGLPALPKLPALPRPQGLPQLSLPALRWEAGLDSWITLAGAGVLVTLLLLWPAAGPELLLALGTLGAVAMLQRRSRRFWPAVGFAFGLLVAGLVLGGLLGGLLSADLPLGLPLQAAQVQSLPALVLLALGALLIA